MYVLENFFAIQRNKTKNTIHSPKQKAQHRNSWHSKCLNVTTAHGCLIFILLKYLNKYRYNNIPRAQNITLIWKATDLCHSILSHSQIPPHYWGRMDKILSFFPVSQHVWIILKISAHPHNKFYLVLLVSFNSKNLVFWIAIKFIMSRHAQKYASFALNYNYL